MPCDERPIPEPTPRAPLSRPSPRPKPRHVSLIVDTMAWRSAVSVGWLFNPNTVSAPYTPWVSPPQPVHHLLSFSAARRHRPPKHTNTQRRTTTPPQQHHVFLKCPDTRDASLRAPCTTLPPPLPQSRVTDVRKQRQGLPFSVAYKQAVAAVQLRRPAGVSGEGAGHS